MCPETGERRTFVGDRRLTEVAENVDELPGMGTGAKQIFDRHHQRVTRMSENGQHIRAEAKDALNQYSAVVARRQGQLIRPLTIVATVFLRNVRPRPV